MAWAGLGLVVKIYAKVTLAVSAVVLVALAVWGVLALTDALTSPTRDPSLDLRPTLLCVSLVGMSIVTYVVWPSRWNIVAHTQLAFSVVAYIVPIVFLHALSTLSSEGLDLYFQVSAVGFLFMFLGTIFGAAIGKLRSSDRIIARANFDDDRVQQIISKRLFKIALLSVLGVVVCYVVMGFIPAFAADPFAAKFFKGVYAIAYAPVAPLYRAATSALSLFVPLLVLNAWKKKTLGWFIVAVGSVGVLLLGLLRDPAVSGVLLLVGVVMAVKGRGLIAYILALIAVYFVGSGFYYLLSLLGVDGYSINSAGTTLLQEVSAGAPDVFDQVRFLNAWILRPEYTHGWTFIGGLMPGNFFWNPSVWSLHVVNPTVAIDNINSGGLRLPAPIWGLVSFGWPGAVLVSAGSGFFMGYLAQIAKRVIPSQSVMTSTLWLVLYVTLLDVVPVFYRLSYLSVLQLVIVLLVFYWHTRRKPQLTAATRSKPLSQHVT